MTEKHLKEGYYFWSGDVAAAEGAIAAGCRFYAGYPITPSSEVAETMALRLPQVGGKFIEMEDEIGSIAAIIGASWTGERSMTATSGPGISLMNENIGLAVMTEVPLVIVNAMRGAPSTGLPTLIGQGDLMQAKYGSHGSYEIITLYPNNIQEAFDLMFDAFNLAEKYRVPVMYLLDGLLAHMYEKVYVPPREVWEKKIIRRKRARKGQLPYQPDEDMIPPMPLIGEGYNIHATGLTHDERGYPDLTPQAQEELVRRLNEKILKHERDIWKVEEYMTEDADVIVVSFGGESRAVKAGVNLARKEGIKAGMLRLITIWPFPWEYITKYSADYIVAEINYGQMYHLVREYSDNDVYQLNKMGGEIHTPEEVLKRIREVSS